MIDHRRIWLTFSRLLKQLLFYTIYKVCKHSLYSINFIAPVYERFDKTLVLNTHTQIKGIYNLCFCKYTKHKCRSTKKKP